ncbi:ATP-dependent helicase rhp16, partial [Tetrabaena socialis]
PFRSIYPYAYYFCRKAGASCACTSLDYPFSKDHRKCDTCAHAPLSHYCWWNRFVANPIKAHGYGGRGRTAMMLLKNRILPAILLRRTKALREELGRMVAADPSSKAIVFSQFTSMLDLCHFRLEQSGIRCVRLEGSMAIEMRERMIGSFTNDPDVRVFLMSLKAGGVALNLTAASHVMLMDPWWNPAVEQQAQDRIHRLGQYKPITVVRFIIAGTIEERILKLQEKKQLVFEGTVGRDVEALGRLTEDDLRFLFG